MAEFRATQASFEVLRELYEAKAVSSFAEAADAPTADAYGSAAAAARGFEVRSWDYYATAADEPVPRHHVERAKSGRSSCRATGVTIEKGALRVGALDPQAGSYSRWVLLSSWRVPSKVWLGLPDPDTVTDVAAFEEALLAMSSVVLSGFAELREGDTVSTLLGGAAPFRRPARVRCPGWACADASLARRRALDAARSGAPHHGQETLGEALQAQGYGCCSRGARPSRRCGE